MVPLRPFGVKFSLIKIHILNSLTKNIPLTKYPIGEVKWVMQF